MNYINTSSDFKGFLKYKVEIDRWPWPLNPRKSQVGLYYQIIQKTENEFLNLPGTDVDKDCFNPSNDCLKTVSIENSS